MRNRCHPVRRGLLQVCCPYQVHAELAQRSGGQFAWDESEHRECREGKAETQLTGTNFPTPEAMEASEQRPRPGEEDHPRYRPLRKQCSAAYWPRQPHGRAASRPDGELAWEEDWCRGHRENEEDM